jgi:pyruvate dehydrogenase (quinone)
VLPDFPYARVTPSCSACGHPRSTTRTQSAALGRGLGAGRPVVLEAVTDPEVPPLPPPHSHSSRPRSSAKALPGDTAQGEIVDQNRSRASSGVHQPLR